MDKSKKLWLQNGLGRSFSSIYGLKNVLIFYHTVASHFDFLKSKLEAAVITAPRVVTTFIGPKAPVAGSVRLW